VPAALALLALAEVPRLLGSFPGRAFALSAGTVILFTVVLCAALYPNALPSSTNHAFDLSLVAASSTSYTLTVMTVVAAIFVPIVLAYQAWTYWVFRHRLGRDDYEGPLTPIGVLEERRRREAELAAAAAAGVGPTSAA
jgi:cytochrome d ubiquinol oxidase subunit II